MVNKGLGRGLGSLIPNKQASNTNAQFQIKPGQRPELKRVSQKPVIKKITNVSEKSEEPKQEIRQQESRLVERISPEQIEVNPWQPRKHFDPHAQEELINSIKKYGIIQPLLVTVKEDGKYQLVAGERRLRSAKFLKLKEVPVTVRDLSELEKMELSLIENIQRQDLNPVEEAMAYNRLIDEFGLTQEELSKRVGKSRSVITNSLRILNLPTEIQEALSANKISMGHAKAILGFKTEKEQINAFRRIQQTGLSVREVEKQSKKSAGRKQENIDPEIQNLEEELRSKLSTKVTIQAKGKSGKIIIDYYSPEELVELVDRMGN